MIFTCLQTEEVTTKSFQLQPSFFLFVPAGSQDETEQVLMVVFIPLEPV